MSDPDRAIDHASRMTMDGRPTSRHRGLTSSVQEPPRRRVSLSVWAANEDVQIFVCPDARLRDRGQSPWPWQDPVISATDKTYGQAGWDVGINFSNLEDLVNKLENLIVPDYAIGSGHERRIRPGELLRLAINAHGEPGVLFVDGTPRASETRMPLRADTARGWHRDSLRRIGLLTPRDGTGIILLVGCEAGRGAEGTNFLLTLSRVWPNCKIVAFTNYGWAGGVGHMTRSSEVCTEPGMRDMPEEFHSLPKQRREAACGRIWNNLGRLPWASETSPNAKIVRNGRIIPEPAMQQQQSQTARRLR